MLHDPVVPPHAQLTLEPRPEGWGVKASELVTQLCNLAGLRNVSIKVHARRRTRFFVAAALQEVSGRLGRYRLLKRVCA